MAIDYYAISISETDRNGYRTWHIFQTDIPGRRGKHEDFAACGKYVPSCASIFSVKASDSFCEPCFREASDHGV